jgi:hypothetical protein
VYAFGYGSNTRERWNETQKKLFDLFGDTPISYDNVQLSEKLNLGRSTIKKVMNGLTEQNYFIQNPVKASTPVSWRRNLDVALPHRGSTTANEKPAKPPTDRPKPPQQSWFSAITR